MERENGETGAALYSKRDLYKNYIHPVTCDNKDSGERNLKYRLNQFAEHEEAFSLISSLPKFCKDQASREASEERFLCNGFMCWILIELRHACVVCINTQSYTLLMFACVVL